ncbi:hypothetical protein FGO68_gene10101 [Halteria grandinella]|uniref:Uncharacterized protein n=1 Tax=Halteria grandinella TaxID=5974 RepID=A0A8J8SU02_HALGN|nr:hypothetical protein FGO68_gene10101 [Halteria grandinella]
MVQCQYNNKPSPISSVQPAPARPPPLRLKPAPEQVHPQIEQEGQFQTQQAHKGEWMESDGGEDELEGQYPVQSIMAQIRRSPQSPAPRPKIRLLLWPNTLRQAPWLRTPLYHRRQEHPHLFECEQTLGIPTIGRLTTITDDTLRVSGLMINGAGGGGARGPMAAARRARLGGAACAGGGGTRGWMVGTKRGGT